MIRSVPLQLRPVHVIVNRPEYLVGSNGRTNPGNPAERIRAELGATSITRSAPLALIRILIVRRVPSFATSRGEIEAAPTRRAGAEASQRWRSEKGSFPRCQGPVAA